MECIADLDLDPSSSCDHRAALVSATFRLDRADYSFSRLTLHCRGDRRPTPSHMHLQRDRSNRDPIPEIMLQWSRDGWNAESHAPSMARQPIHAHRSIHSFAMCGMGYELDKITRLLRSWLHSGVGANKGGADQSAFTHTATPCEKALLPLPRHSAVSPLSRLRRRTSVIFGSVSYAIQPQKPSEGDQKRVGNWGSNTRLANIATRCRPSVELGCTHPSSTASNTCLCQLTTVQEGLRHVRREGAGEVRQRGPGLLGSTACG
ncbi:hypothetical protein L1887_62727 [Cichorium endivia]|nr:hypothetical protein L1887_62727 [Cichorium endivia]